MRSFHACSFCTIKTLLVQVFTAALVCMAAGTIQLNTAASGLHNAEGGAPPQTPAAQYDKAIFRTPIPSDQLAFLNKFAGMESDKAIRDKDYTATC